MKRTSRSAWLVLCSALVAVLLAACGDSSTGPSMDGTITPRTSTTPATGNGDPGDVRTQECYGTAEGGYTCDDLVGGDCNRADAFHSCHEQGGGSYTGGDGGGTGGGGSYGGDTGGSGTPGGTESPMDDENWDCHTDPRCDKRDPSQAEMDRTNAEIDKIKAAKDPFCARIQSNAREMVNRHFQVWTTALTATREDGTTGTLMGDIYWTSEGAGLHMWSGGLVAEWIAHEAMHGMYWQSSDLLPMRHGISYGGRTMKDWQVYCTT